MRKVEEDEKIGESGEEREGWMKGREERKELKREDQKGLKGGTRYELKREERDKS